LFVFYWPLRNGKKKKQQSGKGGILRDRFCSNGERVHHSGIDEKRTQKKEEQGARGHRNKECVEKDGKKKRRRPFARGKKAVCVEFFVSFCLAAGTHGSDLRGRRTSKKQTRGDDLSNRGVVFRLALAFACFVVAAADKKKEENEAATSKKKANKHIAECGTGRCEAQGVILSPPSVEKALQRSSETYVAL